MDEGVSGHGAITGFLKTLALERPQLRVKAVDLPAAAPEGIAEQLLAELMATDGLVEVGYRDGRRVQPELVPGSLADRAPSGRIGEDSVVLLTGGARGITAEVALDLAARYRRPTLVLVGRTAQAGEDSEIAQLSDPAHVRAALIESRRRAGDVLTPALVEADLRRILNGRELRRNLERMRSAGAQVDYRECDVRDQEAFASLIEALYAQYGRLDGVVHGAGVIEDRLIADKRLDSLERVLETKAGSALTLARTLRPESLRFLVLFSSVSGRFGNRGQADYAAASEVLNKLACELDRCWDAARVVSINWGPWRSAGMVSAALEQEFARRGVVLIERGEGCRALARELDCVAAGEPEVVIGAAAGLSAPPVLSAPSRRPGPSGHTAPPALALLAGETEIGTTPEGGTEVVRSLSLAQDRYLDHHRVDGRPVLPFAVAMELMAELAAVAAPGRAVTGLRGIRLLNGITVPDGGQARIRISGRPDPGGDQLDTLIGPTDNPRPSYGAIVQLGERAPAAEAPAALPDLKPFPLMIPDAYRELLFHGPMFQGIVDIDGMDERGSTASLRPSRPTSCVRDAEGLRWLLDPILLDSALQVQVLWARLHWDTTLLPAEIAGHHRYGELREGELARHEMRIRGESNPPMCHVDHWFYGSDGRLIATLTDVVGVGARALNRLAAVARA
jgi:NAD(P)-dependent dehydrogenase (short-subunit alcohol dehydrogenase family)